ncbi:NAD-dependent deacylase [Niveibacterium sp. 24ML]|uniref:SIR2 family NAD-dependent protein deacylase n=1 Tax=Niveibacterium sp. 24ML TaxID=2985512 RepID=UPI00226EDF4A|nr:NAD-dependent deacylase [Niveibacterium sp. 24ML]MCX9155278.1 NAD-dependent deacylase [Niveibacterium sp. 24ML]
MSQLEDTLGRVAQCLRDARRILFITGAGISADSGLPTYRGINGLYNDQLTDEGIDIEDALSGEMLRTHPALTWKYLAQIERSCRGAVPNDAHHALRKIETSAPHALVLTQNVDGLHHAAGSQNLIEIHGSLRRLRCTGCGFREAVTSLEGRSLPPVCAACGAWMRPEVVLFGERLAQQDLERLYAELAEGFDLVFSIGTTSTFPYIVEPVAWAVQAGVPTVEINPQATQISPYVRYRIPLGAAQAMRALLERSALGDL